MSATSPGFGVAAPSSTPPAAAQPWPDAAQLPIVPPARSTIHATTWPRSALIATIFLLCFALSWLLWNLYAGSRWATRPTTLEHNAFHSSRLDLNSADRAQLLQLHGVGESLAARILLYREEHHGFRTLEELRLVHGIGPAIYEKLRTHLYGRPLEVGDEVGDEEAEEPPEPRRLVEAMPRRVLKPMGIKEAAPSKKKPELNRLIDINRASAEELQQLPGIGPAYSMRIIDTRQRAPFTKVDDLRRVSGIGVKTLERLRPLVTVGDAVAVKKE